MSDELCGDCLRAEREEWAVFNVTRWCCRARWIVTATTSRLAAGVTLDQARRSLAERERRMYPGDWPRVRDRMAALKAKEDAR